MCQSGRTTEKLGPFDYSEAKTAYVLNQLMYSLKNTDKKENVRRDQPD
mgnify:CR=1 FL=1